MLQATDAVSMIWKSVFFYIVLVGLVRIMGKREIASLTAIDLVVFIMLSEAAIISIADKEIPLAVGVIPVVMLALLQMVTASLSLKSANFRAIVEGKPSIIIAHGQVNSKEMTRQRLNLNDLMTQLREHNVPDVADVEFAILETSGKLSVLPKPTAQPATAQDVGKSNNPGGLPINLIDDGVISDDALKLIHRDRRWLLAQLGGHKPQNVMLCTYGPGDQMFVQMKGANAKPQIRNVGGGSAAAGAGASANGGQAATGGGGVGRQGASASGGSSGGGGGGASSGTAGGGGPSGASSGTAGGGAARSATSGGGASTGATGPGASRTKASDGAPGGAKSNATSGGRASRGASAGDGSHGGGGGGSHGGAPHGRAKAPGDKGSGRAAHTRRRAEGDRHGS